MKKATKISLLIIGAIIVSIGIAVAFFFLAIEPSINIFGNTELNEELLTSYNKTVRILDKDGQLIDDAFYDSDKIYVRIEDLRDDTVNAFIAIEDKRFYDHHGIDYIRIGSALFSNIRHGKFKEGASTITQQLIKNTHLSNEKTLSRKIEEMRLARALERIYSKDMILENYFNILYFGSGIRGLGTASRVMFGIPSSELSLAQSAALASIINNPSRYNPYKNPDNLNQRKELVLKQMLDLDFIDREEYDLACKEKLIFSKNRQSEFVDVLIKNACIEYGVTEKELFSVNPTFKTQYDPKISESARQAISSMSSQIDGYIRVLVLDNSSGGVACDEANTTFVSEPMRSPASTIKPFISYAPAFESGMTPMDQINDQKTDFNGYSPENYHNIYYGYTSLRNCLVKSSNVAAVTLLNEIGIDKAKSVAEKFGITLSPDDDSLALALGGMKNGIPLIELANAYRTLANGGMFSRTSYFESKIKTGFNVRAVGEDTAYLLTDILCQCAKSGTAKKLKNYGILAAKTGTNGNKNGNTDCYCIAYTPANTIAVWFGAKSQAELLNNEITGSTCCEIIKFMIAAGAIDTAKNFDKPDSVDYFYIDSEALETEHKVYLADPLLPMRFRERVLLSKSKLPARKIDLIDYFDGFHIFDDYFLVDKRS